MTDYIDRQAAIEAVDECTKLKITDDFYTVYTEDMKDMIADIPSADVRENVKGEWVQDEIAKKLNVYLCSNCNIPTQIVDSDGNTKLTRYCPNCGADMRGEA